MAYIHVYNQSGQQLSEGTGETPLSIGPLNSSEGEESAAVEVTIKTDPNFVTFGDTVVSFEGASADKWSVCDTVDGTFAATLAITDPVTEAGTTVYVKARASSDEIPSNDTGVDIKVSAVVAAV